jgi:hypothetical protein
MKTYVSNLGATLAHMSEDFIRLALASSTTHRKCEIGRERRICDLAEPRLVRRKLVHNCWIDVIINARDPCVSDSQDNTIVCLKRATA